MNHPVAPSDLGVLPEWDLSDLYPAPDSPRLDADLVAVNDAAMAFERAYAGRLSAMTGAEFGRAIAEYESIGETLGRVMSFASLLYSGDVADSERGRFYQGMQERVTEISTHTLFITLEINRLDDQVLAELLRAPEAARYAPWLRDVRKRCCTSCMWSAPPPGTACSTRPWRGCAFPWTGAR